MRETSWSGEGGEGRNAGILCWNEGYRKRRRRDLTQPINFSTRTAPSSEVRMFPFSGAWGGGRGEAFKRGPVCHPQAKRVTAPSAKGCWSGRDDSPGRGEVRGDGVGEGEEGRSSWRCQSGGGWAGQELEAAKSREWGLGVGTRNRGSTRQDLEYWRCNGGVGRPLFMSRTWKQRGVLCWGAGDISVAQRTPCAGKDTWGVDQLIWKPFLCTFLAPWVSWFDFSRLFPKYLPASLLGKTPSDEFSSVAQHPWASSWSFRFLEEEENALGQKGAVAIFSCPGERLEEGST